MTDKKKNFILTAFLLGGILFMVIGAVRGEVDTVWRQAVTICLECIGIG